MPYKDPEKQKQYFSKYREKHKQRRAEQIKLWASQHREHVDNYHKAYRLKNQAWIRSKILAKYRSNRRAILKRNYAWFKRNKGYQLKSRERNREKLIARSRAYYQRNRATALRKARDYARTHPHVGIKRLANRRLRIQATIENEHGISQFIKLVRSSKRIACYYCEKFVSGKKAHIEHIVPLARGGGHRSDNLCASCPSCNMSKHAKLLSEWKREGQQVLPI